MFILPVSAVMIIDSISPDYGYNNGQVTVTVTGSGFETEGIWTSILEHPGIVPIQSSLVNIISDSLITIKFDLTGQVYAEYSLVIITGLHNRYSCPTPFIVYYPYLPVVAEIIPSSGRIDEEPFTCTINGDNFIYGSYVRMVNSSGEIVTTSSTNIDNNQFTSVFSPGMKKGDQYLVQVVNPDTQCSVDTVYFTVYDLPPAISDVNPRTLYTSDSLCEISIRGNGFLSGSVVSLLGNSGGMRISNKTPTIVSADGKIITASFDLSGFMTGEYHVIVENPDGQCSTDTVFLQVKEPEKRSFKVTVAPGPGGNTIPYGVVTVLESSTLAVSWTPDSGYEVCEVYLDGLIQKNHNSCIIEDIRGDHEIYVEFKK